MTDNDDNKNATANVIPQTPADVLAWTRGYPVPEDCGVGTAIIDRTIQDILAAVNECNDKGVYYPLQSECTCGHANYGRAKYGLRALFKAPHTFGVDVEATEVNGIELVFSCPFCYTAYNQDGKPRANATARMHVHGSHGDRTYRVEHRIAHCDGKHVCSVCRDAGFNIYITANTKGAHA